MAMQIGIGEADLTLGARVGEGISGHVIRATRNADGMPFALKVYQFEGIDPAHRARERFWRECRILSRLRHPAFPRVFGCGEKDDGTAYAVLEWIDGKPLNDFRDASLDTVLRLSARILGGLRALHHAGAIHRDVAFDNVLVEARRIGLTPRIIDLGAAKDLEDEDITFPGSFLGRLAFAPPEAMQGRGAIEITDPRSDVFSFGVLMYEWLSGRSPFPGSSPAEVLKRHEKGPIAPLKLARERGGPAPPELLEFVNRLLQNEKNARPDSDEALRELLTLRRRLAGGRPASVHDVPSPAGDIVVRMDFAARPFVESLSALDHRPRVQEPVEEEPTAGVEPAPPPTVAGVGGLLKSPMAVNIFVVVSVVLFLAACVIVALTVSRGGQ